MTGNIPQAPKGYAVEVNGWTLEVYKYDGVDRFGAGVYVMVAEIVRDDTDAEVRLDGERFFDHQFRSAQAAMDFVVARTTAR